MQQTVLWIYACLFFLLTPARGVELGQHDPAQHETVEERSARYLAIAESIVRVAYDPAERPVFGGKHGRARTALVLVGVDWKESSLRRDVDLGLGKRAMGGGMDSCLSQQRVGRGGGKTDEGWTHEDLVADRDKCHRAALHKIQRSFSACRSEPVEERLAVYASGACMGEVAKLKSRERMGIGRRLWDTEHAPLTDAVVLAEMAEPATDTRVAGQP